MTQITYPCCSEVILRPTVIKMTFDILSFGDNEADVINDFNAKLSLIKECCLSKPSYKEGSFKKLRSVFKENHAIDRTSTSKRKFLNYSAVTSVRILLNISIDTAKDLISIVNTCTKNSIYCRYKSTILPEEKQYFYRKMYTECMNQGMENVLRITKGVVADFDIQVISDKTEEALMITCKRSKSNKSGVLLDARDIPRLTKELFNNNIILSKRLDIRVRFK